jgi:hypothetical protein
MNSLQQPHEVRLRGLAGSRVGRTVWRARECVADPSVAAEAVDRQVRRGRSIGMTACASASAVCVQVKPPGCLGGFPLLLRRVHPLLGGVAVTILEVSAWPGE